jgi:energy-coupling factor transporter transmembrane protein EcfT
MSSQPNTSSQPYLKGRFTGIFHPRMRQHEGYYAVSDIEWTYLRIEDCSILEDFDARPHRTGDYWFRQIIRTRRMFPWQRRTEVFIPVGENKYYAGDLHNVLIRNVRLNGDKGYFLNKGWEEASGDIYFQLEPKPAPPKETPPLSKPPTPGDVSGTNVIGNPPTEAVHPDDPVSNTRQRNTTLVVNPVPRDSSPGTASASGARNPWWHRLARWIGGILTWLFIALACLYIWTKFRWLAIILAIILLISAIKSVQQRYPLLKTIFGWLIWAVIGYFIYATVFDRDQGSDPVKTRDGRVRVSPPKRDDKGGKGRQRGEIDYSVEKEVEWYDFTDHSYLARYQTSQSNFETSVVGQKALKAEIDDFDTSQEFFSRLFDGMYRMDQEKIRDVARIFSDSAARKGLGPLETAEMVVTFVQEIPYCLVHDGSCEEAVKEGNAFMQDYHRSGKPCLPHVDAGVQSPYAFLHNLKGDCDTRSLLAHAILRELNIASSVWISEAYGHSILGVAVPAGSGLYKDIRGIRHYGVELTSKGFRIGMVASEHARPSNWDITLYTNHD